MFPAISLRAFVITCLIVFSLQRPAAAAAGASWQKISAAGQNTCGIKSDGSAWCWGQGFSGQLGNGTITKSQIVPAAVSDSNVSGKRWSEISAGISYTCGVRDDGTAWCWGRGSEGQRGDGMRTETAATPVAVITKAVTGRKWLMISAASNTTCGLRDDASIWCWGALTDSHEETVLSERPVMVAQRGWRSVQTGGGTICATQKDGSAWCWGSAGFGSLGSGTDAATPDPQIVVSTGVSGSAWIAVAPGGDATCGIRDDGTAWCWGNNANGALGNAASRAASALPVEVNTNGLTGTRWTVIDVNDGTVCGLRDDKSAWCWGRGYSGQLGDDTTETQRSPAPVKTLQVTAWRDISVGEFHTCGIADNGSAWCWGANFDGEVGNGRSDIAGFTPVAAVK